MRSPWNAANVAVWGLVKPKELPTPKELHEKMIALSPVLKARMGSSS